WTTYRAMAEDVLDRCVSAHLLPRTRPGVTVHLPLVGAVGLAAKPLPISAAPGPHMYGAEADHVAAFAGARRQLGGGLTEAMVRFAARYEYARTAEDVLARRIRLLFLDARLAAELAPEVGAILREETRADPQVEAFQVL